MEHEIFTLPRFATQAGAILELNLSYRTHGELSAGRDNAIVVLTSYSAQHDEAENLLAGLDLSDYYIVLIDMLSNGLASLPSNTPARFDGPRFPGITIHDNVACQRQLLQALGVERLRLVLGYSMGEMQAFDWGCQLLDGARAALLADESFSGGEYAEQPNEGLRALHRNQSNQSNTSSL